MEPNSYNEWVVKLKWRTIFLHNAYFIKHQSSDFLNITKIEPVDLFLFVLVGKRYSV